jgi:hypothetical protein
MNSNGGIALKRVVANIYEDTRGMLDQIKDRYSFGSDDKAIKFLCEMFMKDSVAETLARYVEINNEKK